MHRISLTALCVASAPALAAPEFPALTGRVVDSAGLLSPEEERQLTAELKALEDRSSDQVVVVTLPSLQAIVPALVGGGCLSARTPSGP